jgi:hypothetical protein
MRSSRRRRPGQVGEHHVRAMCGAGQAHRYSTHAAVNKQRRYQQHMQQ